MLGTTQSAKRILLFKQRVESGTSWGCNLTPTVRLKLNYPEGKQAWGQISTLEGDTWTNVSAGLEVDPEGQDGAGELVIGDLVFRVLRQVDRVIAQERKGEVVRTEAVELYLDKPVQQAAVEAMLEKAKKAAIEKAKKLAATPPAKKVETPAAPAITPPAVNDQGGSVVAVADDIPF